MTENQKFDLALALFEKYLETKSQAVLAKFWKLYPRPIPSWHLSMMNDQSRNQFYEQELAVAGKDKIIMDLGAGAGLLTQYALEAGAKLVYSVEQDPILQRCLAHTFKQEIQSGRVILLSKNSKELTTDDFTSGTPELVVHEIFGNRLLNEGVLEIFEDLFKRKIVNNTMTIIPQKFSLWGTLRHEQFSPKINDPRFTERFWFLKDISYFGSPITDNPEKSKKNDLSEDFEVFSIDLKKLNPILKMEKDVTALSQGNILRIWFKLHGEQSTLSTDMNTNPSNHWKNTNHYMPFPAGKVTIHASYEERKFLAFIEPQ